MLTMTFAAALASDIDPAVLHAMEQASLALPLAQSSLDELVGGTDVVLLGRVVEDWPDGQDDWPLLPAAEVHRLRIEAATAPFIKRAFVDLVCDDASDFPSDLRHHSILVFGNVVDGGSSPLLGGPFRGAVVQTHVPGALFHRPDWEGPWFVQRNVLYVPWLARREREGCSAWRALVQEAWALARPQAPGCWQVPGAWLPSCTTPAPWPVFEVRDGCEVPWTW